MSISFGTSVNSLAANTVAMSGTNALLGTGSGEIYYSSDGGQTWTISDLSLTGYNVMVLVMNGTKAMASVFNISTFSNLTFLTS